MVSSVIEVDVVFGVWMFVVIGDGVYMIVSYVGMFFGVDGICIVDCVWCIFFIFIDFVEVGVG